MMHFKASDVPVENSFVKSIQEKLNIIRAKIHGGWEYLIPDGKFDRRTEEAVHAFQIYKNVFPVTGELDMSTINGINETFREQIMLPAFTKPTAVEWLEKPIGPPKSQLFQRQPWEISRFQTPTMRIESIAKMELKKLWEKENCSIGELYIDKKFFSFTLDKNNFPKGKYKVNIDPKKQLIIIKDVPGFINGQATISPGDPFGRSDNCIFICNSADPSCLELDSIRNVGNEAVYEKILAILKSVDTITLTID